MPTFVVAVVQDSAVVFDTTATLEKVRVLTASAAKADDRDTWLSSMQHVTLEGRCFVLSACQHVRRRDCPADYAAIQGDEPDAVILRGGSAIIGPLGQVLAGPQLNENGCWWRPSTSPNLRAPGTTSTWLATTRVRMCFGCMSMTSRYDRSSPTNCSDQSKIPTD
jgi:hypothetical protein